ncbi:MAG: hypothetical protein ACREMY_25240 [bacterium]
MKMIVTAGILCAALVLAAITAVQAKTPPRALSDTVTPTSLYGE